MLMLNLIGAGTALGKEVTWLLWTAVSCLDHAHVSACSLHVMLVR